MCRITKKVINFYKGLFLILVLMMSIALGCNKDGWPGKSGGPCYNNGTCDSGLVCVDNICTDNDSGGRSTLDNGSIGSSCGTCNPGLTCITDAPEGYCSTSCSDSSPCNSNAYCYNTESYGALCMRACNSDADCRKDYKCQGTPGSTVCYPAPGGNSGNAGLNGCYAMNNDITFQLWFDGEGQFQDIAWNPFSGSITYSGSYQVSNGQLSLHYDDGSTKTYKLVIYKDGIKLDGTPYNYVGSQCS